jgi:hypothetical protein
MFEKIIEAQVSSEKDKIKDLDVITPDSVRNSGLSVFTKNFITLEAENIRDRKKLDDLIDNSIKLNLNYTLRPKWTILNYIFGKLDSKPTEDILNRLEIFQFYLYYPELISNSLQDSGLVVVTKTNIQSLIDEADVTLHDKFTNNITGLKIKNFFLQLFRMKYDDEAMIGLDSTIPYSFLRIFLEDKGFNDLVNKFKKIEGLRDDWDLDLKTIIKILTDKYSINDDENMPEQPVKDQEPDKPEVKFETPETGEQEQSEEEQKEEPYYRKEEPEPHYPTEVIEESSLYTPKKIKGLFKESELKVILKKVFNSDKLSMRTAFSELENIDNWYYASDYLKKLFLRNNVKIKDRGIVLFIDVLNEYFKKKEMQ